MLRRFLRDRSGTTFEGIALSVSIIAVAFVASADMLDYMTKSHAPAVEGAPRLPVMAAKGNLDYEPTGSLPAMISRSVLDPCNGHVR